MYTISIYNKLGLKLIGYKEEMLKEHTGVIKDALNNSIELFKKNGDIEAIDVNYIQNSNYTLEQFRGYLKSNERFTKSKDEIKDELNKHVQIIEKNFALKSDLPVVFEVNVDDLTFSIKFPYYLSYDYVKEFFGLEDDNFNSLMQKRQILDVPMSLRIYKVFNNALSVIPKNTHYTIKPSLIEPDDDNQQYISNLEFKVNTNSTTNDKHIDSIIDMIIKTNNIISQIYNQQVNIDTINSINEVNMQVISDELNRLDYSKNITKDKDVFDNKEIEENKHVKEKVGAVDNIVNKSIEDNDFSDDLNKVNNDENIIDNEAGLELKEFKKKKAEENKENNDETKVDKTNLEKSSNSKTKKDNSKTEGSENKLSTLKGIKDKDLNDKIDKLDNADDIDNLVDGDGLLSVDDDFFSDDLFTDDLFGNSDII